MNLVALIVELMLAYNYKSLPPEEGTRTKMKRQRPYKFGCPTRRVYIPADITDDQIRSALELRTILQSWKDDADKVDVDKNPRYDQLKKMLDDIQALGWID